MGSHVECLNEDSGHPVGNLLSSDPTRCLKSDIDPQLLVSIPFYSPVKLGALRIRVTENREAAPARIKLFTNRVSLGFSDAESLPAVQVITQEDISSGEVVPLKFVLFQNVVSLQLFVESNQGNVDQTEIEGIELFGIAGESMNMKEFKKVSEHE